MKVKGPTSPLSSGFPEPPDSRDLSKTVKKGDFAAALSQLEAQSAPAGVERTSDSGNVSRTALESIAQAANLTTEEGAAQAVLESARYLVGTRLRAEHGESEQGRKVIEELSQYVASDPLLKTKLLNILKKIKFA